MKSVLSGIALLGLIACAPETPPAANATGAGSFLGLTTAQLADADLKDASGRDLGDVEQVVMDTSGAVTALIVELDNPDPTPDQFVTLPLAGLQKVADGSDWDLTTTLTDPDLRALPSWTPPGVLAPSAAP